MEVIVKNFPAHYNSAFGKVITSERQYKEEMKKGGYIPYDQAKEQTAKRLAERRKFSVSDEAQAWMRDVRSCADKKGNVKLSDRQVGVLKEKGTMTNRENAALKEAQSVMDSRLPEHYRRA